MNQHKRVGTVLVILGWCLIAALTLYPTPQSAETNNAISMWCLVCGDLGLVDVALNCMLFIPLGLGLGLRGLSRRRALLIIFATTFTVELLQLKVIAGRDASLSDLLTNTLGGLLGYALALWWRPIILPRPRVSLALAIAGSTAWLGVQAFSAWAMSRSMPQSVYYGQWAPELAHLEQFTGTVTAVHLNGQPLPGYQLDASEAVRSDLLASRSILDVTARSGDSTTGLAPIFSIFDDRQREILLLGQNGNDLVFRIRTRSDRLRLRGPSIVVPHGLPRNHGEPFQVQAEVGPGYYRLNVEVGGTEISRSLRVSPSWGWTLLLPFNHEFGREMPWLTMLWIGGLLLPVGYWAGRSDRPGRTGGVAALILVLLLGLWAVPYGFSLRPGDLTEWLAGFLGGTVGWMLGRWSAAQAPSAPTPPRPKPTTTQ